MWPVDSSLAGLGQFCTKFRPCSNWKFMRYNKTAFHFRLLYWVSFVRTTGGKKKKQRGSSEQWDDNETFKSIGLWNKKRTPIALSKLLISVIIITILILLFFLVQAIVYTSGEGDFTLTHTHNYDVLEIRIWTGLQVKVIFH